MNLSEDQILALAPDESSKKSGKDLAGPAKWVSKGFSESAIWGECQGSGSKPYQTQVDLRDLAFKCSCPSRKFPCKHGLGLLLFRARQPQQFQPMAAPAWVTEWLNKREEKEAVKAEKKDKPVDEAAQAKRQQARQQKVGDGIEELLRWIKDIIRQGILNLPEKGSLYWENMTKRMVDAQAPGLASAIRVIGEINFYAEGWQTKVLDQLLKIYLIIQGYKNIETLDHQLQQDIRNLIGFPQNQDEIKAQAGIRDDWFILAKQVSEEEKLIVERNWLYGTKTKKPALVLQFYVRSQLPGIVFTPGVVTDATLVFYDSALPLRALVKQQWNIQKALPPVGHDNWLELVTQETQHNSHYPFTDAWPYIVDKLKPVSWQNRWWLQDVQNNLMPVTQNYDGIWKLLSISGGTALPMSLIKRENEYEPVGAWFNNEYKIL